MGNFRKTNQFGGRREERGGFDRGGFRGDRGNSGFGGHGGKSFGQSAPMHQATCAECGKACEVPFRPNGKKPVYCKECFGGGDKAQAPSRDFGNRDFAPRAPYKPEFQERRSAPAPSSDDNRRQFEMLNIKLDKLIRMVEAQSQSQPVPSQEKAPAVAVKNEKTLSETVAKIVASVKKPAKKKTTKKS